MYKKKKATKKAIEQAKPLTPEQLARPETNPLEAESKITARWDGLCGACDGRVEAGQPLYHVRGAGLVRHRVCAPSEDYLTRVQSYLDDAAEAEREREKKHRLGVLKEALAILMRPGEGKARQVFREQFARVEAEAALEAADAENVVRFDQWRAKTG